MVVAAMMLVGSWLLRVTIVHGNNARRVHISFTAGKLVVTCKTVSTTGRHKTIFSHNILDNDHTFISTYMAIFPYVFL